MYVFSSESQFDLLSFHAASGAASIRGEHVDEANLHGEVNATSISIEVDETAPAAAFLEDAQQPQTHAVPAATTLAEGFELYMQEGSPLSLSDVASLHGLNFNDLRLFSNR